MEQDFSGGEPELRKFLGKFGLHGQLALQQIRTLSGGQKARLVFATLAAQARFIFPFVFSIILK